MKRKIILFIIKYAPSIIFTLYRLPVYQEEGFKLWDFAITFTLGVLGEIAANKYKKEKREDA